VGTTTRVYPYPQPSDAPNGAAQMQALAAAIDTDVAALDTALDMGWTAYTPTWTAASTDPVIGNGTKAGRYQKTGKMVTYVGRITMGSTTTFGTGVWYATLPVAAVVTSPFLRYPGSAYFYDNSTIANRFGGSCGLDTVNRIEFYPGSGVQTTGTGPFTWANLDELQWSITYEAAA
jgi:hypothetical protein